MRKFSKLLTVLVLGLGIFLLAGCDTKVEVQGVTDTEILVGNTAATTGDYAAIGVPFNAALEAVFARVNEEGGIDGRMIRFVHYDDGFQADTGLQLTERLVEDDKVFALVGHFGTPTVGATIDYIQRYGLPMVYAATGINQLYFQESPMNPVMAVQPIYYTDGRIMAARAVKEAVFGANMDQALPADAKIGVIYTNDDAGNSIKEGIEFQLEELGRTSNAIFEQVGTEYAAAITKFKNEGVQVVIAAVNQGPFAGIVTQMVTSELHVPVFSSYVNSDTTVIPAGVRDSGIELFINAWVDIFTTAGQAAVADFVDVLTRAELLQYATNNFAIAGYIAGMVFVEGLERVAAQEDKTLTFASYIAAMESAPIQVPFGGTVDFGNGHRWGIASMSLLHYQEIAEAWTFAKVREIETIEQILAK